eukprot:364397-Chlamydomonas_euryale.AAC.10
MELIQRPILDVAKQAGCQVGVLVERLGAEQQKSCTGACQRGQSCSLLKGGGVRAVRTPALHKTHELNTGRDQRGC